LRISELAGKTGIPKETIHYYIREGVLPKPRKLARNIADYDEGFVEQILVVKDLQDRYFLPLSVIKKVIRQQKKHPFDQTSFQIQSEYFNPIDQLLTGEIRGTEAFLKATGLGKKWLLKMEEWGVITSHMRQGEPVYSRDDLVIGKLAVDMDRLGIGPKDGHDPEDLRHVADFVQCFVRSSYEKYYERNLKRFASGEKPEGGNRIIEVMSLFFYHLYRRCVREEHQRRVEHARNQDCEREGRS